MGEARRRRDHEADLVWHHTSTLRTNQLWMSGYILPEGKMPNALHPKLGEIQTDAIRRRAMEDFPPLAWFTRRIETPGTLLDSAILLMTPDGTERCRLSGRDLANAIALQRIAIGFRIGDVPVVPWPEHPGFSTAEGRELNESARDAGDDPIDWHVSEAPVDLLLATEIRGSGSIMKPKLQRMPAYLPELKKMVSMCRETPGVFIPPSWLKEDEAKELARQLGKPVANLQPSAAAPPARDRLSPRSRRRAPSASAESGRERA